MRKDGNSFPAFMLFIFGITYPLKLYAIPSVAFRQQLPLLRAALLRYIL